MERIVLTPQEIVSIKALIAEIAADHDSVENPELLRMATLLAHEMPRRLRAAFLDFRLAEPDSALLVVSGFPVDQDAIGPTPDHWRISSDLRFRTLAEEILFVLQSSLLGECIGWSTQQEGKIVHEVLPIQGFEQEQISTGSEQPISWHTEDAFHPLRGDYVALFCLRNPDRIPTTFASLAHLGLDPEDWRLLFEPHFPIRPDLSHLPATAGNSTYQKIERMQQTPEKIAVLSGDVRSPYVRIDPFFMESAADGRAQRALENLMTAIDRELQDFVLEPGDACFIDNFKAVHGRRAFKARYDGRDRWLKRINIARDLRKSRAARESATSRIIA